MQGQNYQVDKEPLLGIPLHVPSKTEQERVARIVQSVIRSLNLAAAAKTDGERTRLRRQAEDDDADVQEAVEELYGLTDADRELITCACPDP